MTKPIHQTYSEPEPFRENTAATLDFETRRIIDDIRLRSEPGIIGLIGPNGSGKSMLLRSVYRMLRPEAVYVRLEDGNTWQVNTGETEQPTGGLVLESACDFKVTVYEIVMAERRPHMKLFGKESLLDEAIAWGALKQVGMMPFRKHLYGMLSADQKQRVLMARALAQEPKWLVIEGPAHHVHNHFQAEILGALRRLGLTTVVTLNDLNLAGNYCHRLYLLNAGHIVAAGSPAEVLTPEHLHYAFEDEALIRKNTAKDYLQHSFSAIGLSSEG